MTGADLQWWHFVIALATMLVFVAWDAICAIDARDEQVQL